MIKKFNKRQLLDQCGFTADETKIILDYQKKLPVLVENDNVEGFCVNARDLHRQLGVKSQFSKWIQSNLDIGDSYENEDFVTKLYKDLDSVSHEDYANYSPQKLSALGISKEYFLKIETAKEIAMYTGTALRASKELKRNSKLTRRYFILMEKAVKKNVEWEIVRHPLRQGYKKMQVALNEHLIRTAQRNADSWDYSIEADALNVIATGFKAQEIRAYVKCKDNLTRDSLTITYNEYLSKLQELNIVYLGMDMNRYERYKMLRQSFEILFPNAVPIRDDIDISRIIKNKNALIEEVRLKVQRAAS